MEATTAPELDERTLLATLAEQRDVVALAEVEQLEWVLQWARTHPAQGDTTVLAADEHPGGDGTPAVAAFTAEPLAGALRISPAAAQSLLGDVLDLVHRLPRLWDHVRALTTPVWKARRIARATRRLDHDSARWVDRQLIGTATLSTAALDRLIATAVARADTRTQADREAAARATWDVNLTHPRDWVGTSTLTATGDTRALTQLADTVQAEAEALARAGDTDPAGARRVKALTRLATHGADQLAFALRTEAAASAPDQPSGSTAHGESLIDRRTRVRLYLHANLADIVAAAFHGTGGRPDGTTGDRTGVWSGRRTYASSATHVDAIGSLEKLGPMTLSLIKEWLGHSKVTVVPVLDLAGSAWSPRHDPPPRMREQVVLRHPGCVFPYCGRDARSCDLDHVVPWHPDEDSREDQKAGRRRGTRPDNLAPLCRRHHRAKTNGRWHYDTLDVSPEDPPDHLWTGPHGQTFLVSRGNTVDVGR